MESLTTVQDGNGALCASVASGFTGLMGYYSSRTMMASNLLWWAASNVGRKERSMLWRRGNCRWRNVRGGLERKDTGRNCLIICLCDGVCPKLWHLSDVNCKPDRKRYQYFLLLFLFLPSSVHLSLFLTFLYSSSTFQIYKLYIWCSLIETHVKHFYCFS